MSTSSDTYPFVPVALYWGWDDSSHTSKAYIQFEFTKSVKVTLATGSFASVSTYYDWFQRESRSLVGNWSAGNRFGIYCNGNYSAPSQTGNSGVISGSLKWESI